MYELPDTLVAGEKSKLPAEYAALADERTPLPEGVQFFERQLSSSELFTTLCWACGLALIGVLLVPFGVYFIWWDLKHASVYSGVDYVPLVAGGVFLLGAWMMLSSLQKRWEILQLQKKGQSARIGLLLTPASIFEINEFGYCAIPRAQFRGLAGNTLRYTLKDQEKSILLPAAIVKKQPEELKMAIARWTQG